MRLNRLRCRVVVLVVARVVVFVVLGLVVVLDTVRHLGGLASGAGFVNADRWSISVDCLGLVRFRIRFR